MTLGEHIQELRKAAGLSQEALGEALGVTRQSISKWESDNAMPEVEKLIAMSRLFGVTVGSLLQVEEGTALGEDQLRAVETVARQYLAASGAGRRPKWPWVLALGTLLIGLALGAGTFRPREAPPPAAEETRQPRKVETEELWREGGVLAEFSAGCGMADYRAGTVTLRLSARPARLEADGAVSFLVDAGMLQSREVAAESRDGLTYTAECAVPLDDEIRVSVVLAGKETVVQPAMVWRNLNTAFSPEIEAVFTGDQDWDEASEVLRVTGQVEAEMRIPYQGDPIPYQPTGVSLYGTRIVQTEKGPGLQTFAVPVSERAVEAYPFRQSFSIDIPVAPGQRVELRLVTTWQRDNGSNSMETTVVAAYRDEDGTFHLEMPKG